MSLSEFDYPQRMRALLTAIRSELVAPCRAEYAGIRAAHEAAHASAAGTLSEVKEHVRNMKVDEDAALARVLNEARGEMEQVEGLLKIAFDHLRAHKVRIPQHSAETMSPTDGKLPEEWDNLDIVKETIKRRLSYPVSALVANTRLPYWPKAEMGRAAIVTSSVFLYFMFGKSLLILFWWPAFVFVSRRIWEAVVKSDYGRIAAVAGPMITGIDRYIDHAGRESAQRIRSLEAKHLPSAEEAFRSSTAVADSQLSEAKEALQAKYLPVLNRVVADLHQFWATCGFAATPWNSPAWESWTPDPSPGFAARIGTFTLDAVDLIELFPDQECTFTLPALVPFADERCLLLSAEASSRKSAAQALQAVALRALANTPPGKARFTFIDPVALGDNAADFLALGDYAQALVGGKAWTEPHHIEQQLAELTEHMETVIQKYLRREFATISAYNESAHEVAEPFRFLVIFDFPAGFTEDTLRRLTSIVRNGPRCGVHVLILRDTSRAMPYGFEVAALEAQAIIIDWENSKTGGVRATWRDADLSDAHFDPDQLPDTAQQVVKRIVEASGQSALEAMKVEVPFKKLLALAGIEQAGWWSGATSHQVRAPLGPSGARRIQYLEFGSGLAHHGLIIGRTGSGKTNLMHVIITSLALVYPPDELSMYLIDLKGGVGFKPYARYKLPHATVIAIESDREFALSVLQGLEAELKRRFEVFRAAGVDNIQDFRTKVRSPEPLPRILLVVDEFQQLLVQEDVQAQQARGLLDRIATQGRSFGLHLLLATQSLAGNSRLSASTMGQLVVRIALPCSDADARLILGEGNLAARSLSRPGEGVYNAAGGEVDGNNPFQGALFTDQDLEGYLGAISTLSAEKGLTANPVVFEGNEPASLASCAPLKELVGRRKWSANANAPTLWLGEPVAMGRPVSARLSPQAGRHVLVIERDEASGLGVLYSAWTALLATHRPGTAEFHLLDFSTAESGWSGHGQLIQDHFAHQVQVSNRRTLPDVLMRLAGTAKNGPPEPGRPLGRTYVMIVGLHRARDLRPARDSYYEVGGDGEANLPELFQSVLRDGPEAGIHVLAWCDTLANARRALGNGLREIGIRVAGPMAAEDSDAFLDATDAARLDKPYRMLLADEERPGALVKILPYAIPEAAWLQALADAQACWTE